LVSINHPSKYIVFINIKLKRNFKAEVQSILSEIRLDHAYKRDLI